MSKQIEIERVTCRCGQVIAGCVQGQQDSGWNEDKSRYEKQGCTFDTVTAENFKFGNCQCADQPTKKRFKFAAKPERISLLFKI